MSTSPSSPPHASNDPLELEIERVRTEILRRKGTSHFEHFVRAVTPSFRCNWHHSVLCNVLERFARREFKRLMIFTAPRHGKTYLVSEHLPAYLHGLYPDESLMWASYAASLARRSSRMAQRILRSEEYRRMFPATRIKSAGTRDAAGHWIATQDEYEVINRRGVYKCAGVGGDITGRGFGFGCIDDPVADREAADSIVQRENTHSWYHGTFWSRQETDQAGILLTMTRWHEDDLAGRLLKEAAGGGEPWHVLWLPARAEEELPEYLRDNPGVTVIGRDDDERQEGQGLWLGKYGQPWYDNLEARPARELFSLYQNRPMDEQGETIKSHMLNAATRIHTDQGPAFQLATGHVVPLSECLCFDVVDLASSEKKTADFTAIGTFYGHPGTRALIFADLVHDRIPGGKVKPQIIGQQRKHNASWTGIEKQHGGQAMFQELQGQGEPVREFDADKDKFVRCNQSLDFWENGGFHMAADLPKHAVAKAELLAFRPGCSHDDIVDICVYAVLFWKTMIRGATVPSAPPANIPSRREQVWSTVRPPRPRR